LPDKVLTFSISERRWRKLYYTFI